ncbi:MAG: NTP transferase domain-containing protein [Sphingomonadaceae bacterium]
MSRATCGAIILAAGMSRRMGSNKLLALYQGKPLAAHVASAVEAAGLPAIMVLGHAEGEMRAALADHSVRFAVAEDHACGMGHSIAAGIRAAPPEWQAAIICLGDMPLISPALLRRMANDASASTILIPTFDGRRGNPVLWGRNYFPLLEQLHGDSGARGLFEQFAGSLTFLPWRDDSILRDFDTPAALQRLQEEQS